MHLNKTVFNITRTNNSFKTNKQARIPFVNGQRGLLLVGYYHQLSISQAVTSMYTLT